MENSSTLGFDQFFILKHEIDNLLKSDSLNLNPSQS